MVLATAAVVIVAAIGVLQGARWLGIQSPAQTVPEEQPEQPTPVVAIVAAAESRETPVAKDRESRPQRAAGSALKKPPTSAKPLAPVAAALAPSPVPETPAPVEATPPLVAAEPPRSVAPGAPSGRLFEPKDVDEPPRIAARVEPQLPGNLPASALNDVVVVRVLVSHTGHPFRVSLLRGSRLGRSLDEAVIAAVTQWTFSPARKRGEAVSCWYNFGVPLGRAN